MTRFRWRGRRGAAAVETALVLPVLIAMVLGIIEFGWMISVKNSLVHAAREGAREGALQSATVADAQARTTDELTAWGLQDKATIAVVDASDADPFVRVTVTVQKEEVSLVGNFFGHFGGTITGSASMRKEGPVD